MRRAIPSQWQLLRHDHWLLACLTWVPILLAGSIWWIFSAGVVQNLPIGVVDLSHSQLSRQLVRELDATSTLSVTRQYQNVAQAKDDMVTSDIYAYVVIPYQFDKAIYRGEQPRVTTFYNSQYILVGRLINSAVVQAQGTLNAQIDVVKTLASGEQTTLSAMGRSVPVRTQITALFNKNTNYAQFLVSAIVPALWQIVVVVSTILILTANYREYGLKAWLDDKPLLNLTRTLLPYYPMFVLQGAAFLIWFYSLLQWPMHGSFAVLIGAQMLTAIACMIMGAAFYFLTLDPARAMSFAGAFTAPSFAFMGITFPTSDMGSLAQAWRSLLPISHYIEVQVSQVSYGLSAAKSLSHLWPMVGYVLPLLLTLALIRKHQSKEQTVRSTHDPV
ncbi:ABC transporter permease [Vibrio fluvialis]|uniref:ABC-type multidrug transport system, permease component n=1 Tax=Vibrio fluvialis PG41 TaxID=1336752 RepID=S7JLD4_VIBFL|nr:ABC transporter permease [Vibrio fluvialis]EKO3367717.1 ABC transporter permease [Vibrio fluvialis]EKO3371613.1 ABC transporter permease [Vibrio fluvialis]EKO3384801.1 ABC transporter permease [Vibrio fluvialis]EKO3395782.1 ABC transporter permease [Vibrio fluvialis]EKO3417342.1 ABC transporter permease [Vibrio fluvialis]